MEKTAVVFGASGLIGKEIIKILSDDDEFRKILIVVRKPQEHTLQKIKQVVFPDFSLLPDIQEDLKSDVFFCCIGTTIKKAGSQEAFSKVDLDIPVKIAQLASKLSIPSVVVISSLGANTGSSNFYLRTKGRMEESVAAVFKGNLKFVRPSLLMGDREEYRFGESAAIVFMKAFGWLFSGPLKKYRGISASDVARCMIKISAVPDAKKIYESDEMQQLIKNQPKS